MHNLRSDEATYGLPAQASNSKPRALRSILLMSSDDLKRMEEAPLRSSEDMPPLQALRVFEAVGRLLSFRRAGEELLITQSAVSHHIRKLELSLGRMLFERRGRSIALTDCGAWYFETVTGALRLIADATAELTRSTKGRRVRIGLPPSVAANWLVSRIGAFTRAHPDISLELTPRMRKPDLARGEADLSIVYGNGQWPGVQATLLCQEELLPVLSPGLAAIQPFDRPEHVYNHVVLLSRSTREWPPWFAAHAIDPKRVRVLQLTDYNLVLQAAIDGEGVAMGRKLLVRDRLTSSALICPPIAPVLSAETGHWVLATERATRDPAVQAVMRFLIEAARGDLGAAGEANPPEARSTGVLGGREPLAADTSATRERG